MNDTSETRGCAARCWRVSAYAGLAFAVLFLLFGGVGLITAAIAGVVVFAILGFAASRFLCPDADEDVTAELTPEPTPAPVVETAPEPEPEQTAAVEEPVQASDASNGGADVPEVVTEPAAQSGVVKPSTVLPGQVELASRKGSWRYEPNKTSA